MPRTDAARAWPTVSGAVGVWVPVTEAAWGATAGVAAGWGPGSAGQRVAPGGPRAGAVPVPVPVPVPGWGWGWAAVVEAWSAWARAEASERAWV
ncbi:hypothetical protein GCM10010340_37080 [Streptomyces griseoloalbus]|nr:hypothetical protein GCM10010340_37080 [Streptomyces albaduncus]